MSLFQKLFANKVREEAQYIVKHVQAMPPDKQTWKPLDNGRSALDMLQECAQFNRQFAKMIAQRSALEWNQEDAAALKAECDTVEKAMERFQKETESLAEAIAAFPTEHLEDQVALPWDPHPTAFANAITMPYWNMVYHLGQICYIQTLYGDQNYYYFD